MDVTEISNLSAETLTPILYHVLGIEAKTSDLSKGYIKTLSSFILGNHSVNILVDLDSGVHLNKNTSVSAVDVMASNGVIHIVDKILLSPTVVDIAIANTSFTNLVATVVKTGLVDALSVNGSFTVFAPTDSELRRNIYRIRSNKYCI